MSLNEKSKKLLILILTAVGLSVASLIILNNSRKTPNSNDNLSFTGSLESDKPKVKIGETEFFVEIAKTPEEQSRGLSGRKMLKDNEGMLFVWEKKLTPTFWMKDMNFAIDIIWINDGKIVGVLKNVQPEPGISDRELTTYPAPSTVDMVLEVNAGFSQKNGINVGNIVTFTKN